MSKGKKKNQKENKEASGKKRRLKFWLFSALIFLAILAVAFGGYSIAFGQRVYLNVKVGDSNLGGKNKSEIAAMLKSKADEALNSQITLKYQPESGEEREYKITSSDIGLSYDLDKTAKDVYAVGRSGNAQRSFGQQLSSLFLPYNIDASYNINEDALNKKIADIAAEIDLPEKDFELKYAGNGVFELTKEKQAGRRIDQDQLISNIKFQISNIKIKELTFKSEVFQPQITEENAHIGLAEANKILAAGVLILNYDNQNFSLDVDTIAGLVSSRPKKKQMEIYIVPEKTAKQVKGIAGQIDKPAGNAVLSAQDGKIVVSSESQNGAELAKEQTKIDIENALLKRMAEDGVIDTEEIALKVKPIAPEIDSAKLTSYGLTELVATGTTNFAKSPQNRIHNINIGASAISGALIKPGEEFSTLSRLGKIDAEAGYLPELVIKNNKTIPDYGGGLCQVSTTLFRAALNAGMNITARQNHSYRVSYYEPPIGMDATIFNPAPDFKFINNYGSYIFIQSKIVGTNLTFEFYGSKDSRQVDIGQAVGFDYVSPPAAVETVDPSLPPGTRNLISHSHQGASAKFHYKVSRGGQILQETDFLSKYAALPEIWQVGPTDTPAVDPNAAPVDTPPPA